MKYLRTMGIVASALLLLIMTACGGNNNDKDKRGSGTATLTLSPTTTDVVLGKSQTFTITATNTDFTVTGNGCTKNNATTVVCTPTSEGVHELTVTATADTTLTRKATMTVKKVDIAIATVTGEVDAAVMVGDSVTFVVTTTNTDFTMTPSDKAGCVRTDDVITCTPTEFGDYNLVVTATADITKAAMAKIKAYEVSIAIDPESATVTVGEPVTFKVTTSHTGFDMDADPAVDCVRSGNDITCTPTVAGTYDLTVTATEDSTKTATATITAVSDGPMEIEGMVFVEAGTFTMGCTPEIEAEMSGKCGDFDAKPTFQVTLTQNFYIGKYEVTQAEWKEVMNDNNPSEHVGDNLPVTNVTWHDAQSFIAALNEQKSIPGWKWALPTEAQWEYAAKAGTNSAFGSYVNNNSWEVAWINGISDGNTHPVGMLKPNDWGLYDMFGNVMEWLADWFGPYPSTPQIDYSGVDEPPMWATKNLRGGAFYQLASSTTTVARDLADTSVAINFIGLRLALIPDPDVLIP